MSPHPSLYALLRQVSARHGDRVGRRASRRRAGRAAAGLSDGRHRRGDARTRRRGGTGDREHAVCRRRSPAHRRGPRRDRLPGRNRHRGRRVLGGRGDLAHARAPDCGHDGSHPARGGSVAVSQLPAAGSADTTETHSISTARGSTTSRMGTSGIRRSGPTGVRTSYGSWSPIRSYGWTWVGAEAWAWPTHHYGRWGFARNAWFWIPGRTWGAAWVSWSFADDYVSWCPLGWNSRPVFALSIGSRRGWDDWTVPRRIIRESAFGIGTRRPSTLSTRSLTDSRRPSRRTTTADARMADRVPAPVRVPPAPRRGSAHASRSESGFGERRNRLSRARRSTDTQRPDRLSTGVRLPSPEARRPTRAGRTRRHHPAAPRPARPPPRRRATPHRAAAPAGRRSSWSGAGPPALKSSRFYGSRVPGSRFW